MPYYLFSSIVNFIIAGYNLTLPFSTYAFPHCKFKTYAIFLTAEAIGGLVGALISTFISGLVLVPSSKIFLFSNSAILVSICIAAFNLLLSIYNIQFMTFIQMMTDRNHIGRVFGIIFSIAIIFMPLGTFFFQAILDLKSIYNYLLFGKLLIITASIAIIMSIFISND